MAPLRVIIVGSGVAGSCLANGLINSVDPPFEVAVYERDDESANRSGYQIRLGAHGLTGLRACLSPDQYQNILSRFGRSGGAISSAPSLYDKNLNLVLDLSKFPAYTKSAPINRSVLRDELQKNLREKGVLHYGMQWTRYEVLHAVGNVGSSRVRVHFADGTTDDCDILIASDGNRSKANIQLGADNIIELTKRQGFLAKGALPWSLLRTLPEPLIRKGSLSCLSGDMVMFAAAYLPDKFQQTMEHESNTFDFIKDDLEKPSQYDESEASLMVGLQWPTDPEWPAIETIPNKADYMLSKVKNWAPGYHRLVQAISPDDVYVVQSRVAKPLQVDWRDKTTARPENMGNTEIAHPRVWLMGDAIHPMLPSRGMGANQALHDTADALTELKMLGKLRKSGEVSDAKVKDALKRYENAMIPRAFSWVQKSGGTSEDVS
jgi:2-polyprenyl-6-methoxyphenol hydroxylase-like FAD-dependent oxidoreductase